MTYTTKRRPFLVTVVAALILALTASAATFTMTAAQESQIPAGAPVDIHSGTCSDFLGEPAYDGGDITETTVDDMWGDETFMTGIFTDDELQASGVDFNNDGQLQEDEVIVPNDVNAPMGHAEADLGSEVNTDEPYVVVLHASPEQYDTYIACGTLEGAESTDNGTLIYLQGINDSNFFGYSVLDGTTLNTYLFQPNTQPLQGAAGEQVSVPGHPVGIHSGVCQDFVAEPIYDIGDFMETNVYAEGEQEAGDMEGDVPSAAQDLGPVYKLAGEGADIEEDTILDPENPRVVVVHESAENFSNLVACGQILPVMDGDDVAVFLHPVAGSNLTGYIEMPEDVTSAQGFLWTMEDFSMQQQAEATPPQAGTPAPIETQPPATPTQEATAVITETEVVPAPTATALAGGTPEQAAEETPVEVTGVEIGGEEAVAITAAPGQVVTVVNSSENERTVSIPDLQIEQVVAPGEQFDIQLPADVEPGDYSYQVLEGEENVLEGTITIE